MSLLSRLTVTPLLYACGALLVVVAGLGVRVHMLGSDAIAADARRAAAVADRDAARTERNAWKAKANDLIAANSAYGVTVDTLRQLLDEARQAARVMAEQDRKAIAQARADAADADRTLQLFTAKYQAESRKPDCAKALLTLEAACPALSGY